MMPINNAARAKDPVTSNGYKPHTSHQAAPDLENDGSNNTALYGNKIATDKKGHMLADSDQAQVMAVYSYLTRVCLSYRKLDNQLPEHIERVGIHSTSYIRALFKNLPKVLELLALPVALIEIPARVALRLIQKVNPIIDGNPDLEPKVAKGLADAIAHLVDIASDWSGSAMAMLTRLDKIYYSETDWADKKAAMLETIKATIQIVGSHPTGHQVNAALDIKGPIKVWDRDAQTDEATYAFGLRKLSDMSLRASQTGAKRPAFYGLRKGSSFVGTLEYLRDELQQGGLLDRGMQLSAEVNGHQVAEGNFVAFNHNFGKYKGGEYKHGALSAQAYMDGSQVKYTADNVPNLRVLQRALNHWVAYEKSIKPNDNTKEDYKNFTRNMVKALREAMAQGKTQSPAEGDAFAGGPIMSAVEKILGEARQGYLISRYTGMPLQVRNLFIPCAHHVEPHTADQKNITQTSFLTQEIANTIFNAEHGAHYTKSAQALLDANQQKDIKLPRLFSGTVISVNDANVLMLAIKRVTYELLIEHNLAMVKANGEIELDAHLQKSKIKRHVSVNGINLTNRLSDAFYSMMNEIVEMLEVPGEIDAYKKNISRLDNWLRSETNGISNSADESGATATSSQTDGFLAEDAVDAAPASQRKSMLSSFTFGWGNSKTPQSSDSAEDDASDDASSSGDQKQKSRKTWRQTVTGFFAGSKSAKQEAEPLQLQLDENGIWYPVQAEPQDDGSVSHFIGGPGAEVYSYVEKINGEWNVLVQNADGPVHQPCFASKGDVLEVPSAEEQQAAGSMSKAVYMASDSPGQLADPLVASQSGSDEEGDHVDDNVEEGEEGNEDNDAPTPPGF